jgi:integrase
VTGDVRTGLGRACRRDRIDLAGTEEFAKAGVRLLADGLELVKSPALAGSSATDATFCLGVVSGQRRSDVVQLGPQHLRDGVLHLRRQQKTGTGLQIPVHPELKVVLEATPSEHLTFLTTFHGRPFTPAGFTNWFRECCNQAGLPNGTSAHGLRKATCRRLAEAGCSENVIAAISGHKSLKEVQRYTAAANQLRLAQQGMDAVRREFRRPQ